MLRSAVASANITGYVGYRLKAAYYALLNSKRRKSQHEINYVWQVSMPGVSLACVLHCYIVSALVERAPSDCDF